MGLIETFLLKKISDAIKTAKPSPHSTYLSQLQNNCTNLEVPIEKTNNPDVRETLYRLNNEFLLLKNCHHSFIDTHRCSSVKALSETLKKIELLTKEHEQEALSETLKKIELLTKEHEQDDPKKSKTTFWWSTRLADPTAKIPGFEDRAMVRMLDDEDEQRFKSIGIIGMAGVGKTTLCQVSFGNQKVRDRFFPRIWVCMSTEKDEVARRMLRCLGFEEKYVGRLGNSSRAVEQQLKGKKYLVVLDNVDEVALPSWLCGDGAKGKVIVTSRSEKAAGGIVGKKNLHELLAVVDKERCWEIFTGEAKKDGCWDKFMGKAKICYGNDYVTEEDEKIKNEKIKNEKIEGEIVESCDGLSLVAKMKGQILHHQYMNI